jgi:hypothetical protein
MRHRLLVAIGAAALAAGIADAKPGADRGKPDRGGGESSGRDGGVDIDIDVILGDEQRRIVRDYYGERCPPGLAKKNNGCLPPGIAKKRYEIGRPIPDGYDRLPDDLVLRLPRLDDGYGYLMIDGDLVVVALATMIVIDAIGLS